MNLNKFLLPQLAAGLCFIQALSPGSAKALSFQIVVDNDFARFSGTSTSVNTLLYQNNVDWNNQNVFQTIVDPPASDNVYYLLAMGGGGDEEAFGTIGILSLTTESGVKVSNDLSGSLTGYSFSAVEEGSYEVKLVDVQAAFPSLTFSAPPATSCGYVCNAFSGLSSYQSFGQGGGTAVLYAIHYGAPPPASVPGPLPIFGVLCAFQESRRIRRGIRLANM